jgi:hypothetical protein
MSSRSDCLPIGPANLDFTLSFRVRFPPPPPNASYFVNSNISPFFKNIKIALPFINSNNMKIDYYAYFLTYCMIFLKVSHEDSLRKLNWTCAAFFEIMIIRWRQ